MIIIIIILMWCDTWHKWTWAP